MWVPGSELRFVRLGKYLYPLSHPASPQPFFVIVKLLFLPFGGIIKQVKVLNPSTEILRVNLITISY